jgi:hypothetical protein
MSIKLSINKNHFYSIRFRINKQLQSYFNKTHIKKSLFTKNLKEAQSKADVLHFKLELALYFKYKRILGVHYTAGFGLILDITSQSFAIGFQILALFSALAIFILFGIKIKLAR